MTLTLRSPAFEPGASIPARFDHEQGDLSPALDWDGVPEGTAALVLLVDDPDAPVEGSFVHWVLYNLDPARQGIAEGEEPAEAAAGAAALRWRKSYRPAGNIGTEGQARGRWESVASAARCPWPSAPASGC